MMNHGSSDADSLRITKMLPEKVIVLEDVISKEHQDKIEKILSDNMFHWFYISHSSYKNGIPDWLEHNKNVIDSFQMFHVFYADGRQNSDAFPTLLPLISSFPFNIDKLIRLKANMTTYHPEGGDTKYGPPHIDSDEKGTVSAIYYVNDSTGDTFIFNETKEEHLKTKTLTVKKRVSPKKGTLVVFDGSLLHSGNYPHTVDPRMVINFCLVPFRRLYI
jgi:hypothetical protein